MQLEFVEPEENMPQDQSALGQSAQWTARLEALEVRAASTRAQAGQDAPAHFGALIALGQMYLEAGNAPKALTQFEEGLELAQQHGDSVFEARFLGFKGMALVKIGNFSFAQRALFGSLKLAEETEQTALVIDTLMRIAELHAITGQQAKAISRLEQAYGLAMQAGEDARQMLAAGQLGDLFLSMEATDKALDYYAAAMDKAEVVGNQRAVTAFRVGIGDVLLVEGDLAQAAGQFEAALDMADALQDRISQLRSLNGLLRTQIAAERTTLAQLYGDRVVQIARDIGDDRTEIANLNLLVTFLLQQEQARKAIPYLKRGLEIAQAQEDWSWQLSMLTNLGYAYHESEDLAPALDAYGQALLRAEQLQDQMAFAQLQGRMGAVLADMGELQAGVDCVHDALGLAQELGSQSLVGEQQILLAFLYHDLDEQEQALAFCRQAVATFTAIGDAAFTAKAQALLTELS